MYLNKWFYIFIIAMFSLGFSDKALSEQDIYHKERNSIIDKYKLESDKLRNEFSIKLSEIEKNRELELSRLDAKYNSSQKSSIKNKGKGKKPFKKPMVTEKKPSLIKEEKIKDKKEINK